MTTTQARSSQRAHQAAPQAPHLHHLASPSSHRGTVPPPCCHRGVCRGTRQSTATCNPQIRYSLREKAGFLTKQKKLFELPFSSPPPSPASPRSPPYASQHIRVLCLQLCACVHLCVLCVCVCVCVCVVCSNLIYRQGSTTTKTMNLSNQQCLPRSIILVPDAARLHTPTQTHIISTATRDCARTSACAL